jgi:undecaprenyl diphosphate synthase
MSLNLDINNTESPKHVAIIMDGNGRWAQQNGEERLFGHVAGVEAVRRTVKAAAELNIKYLTLYAFSVENWNRPKEEVDGLMNLLVDTLVAEIDGLHEDGVRLKTIGDIQGLPNSCQNTLLEAIEKTQKNSRITLVLALNYSSRWEIINAARTIALKVQNKHIDIEAIDEELFNQHMATKEMPEPELIIRTSGEHRLSNFLLWQSAYSELYFSDVFWPDFDKEHLFEAIKNYQCRERRFGMVSEQLNKIL